MPVLTNAKHEIFAQEVAKGKTASEAYVLAGYKENDGNAARLNGDERIRGRVDEILNSAAQKAELSIAKVLDELGKVGFANMLDYIRIGEDGLPYTDFSSLTREQAAAIGEIQVDTVTEYESGDGGEKKPIVVRKVKFKLAPKTPALDLLGRHFGAWKDRVEHTGKDGGPIKTEDVSETEIARRVAFMFARATKQPPSGGA